MIWATIYTSWPPLYDSTQHNKLGCCSYVLPILFERDHFFLQATWCRAARNPDADKPIVMPWCTVDGRHIVLLLGLGHTCWTTSPAKAYLPCSQPCCIASAGPTGASALLACWICNPRRYRHVQDPFVDVSEQWWTSTWRQLDTSSILPHCRSTFYCDFLNICKVLTDSESLCILHTSIDLQSVDCQGPTRWRMLSDQYISSGSNVGCRIGCPTQYM